MRKLEHDVEASVVLWAERYGIWHTKLNIEGRRGWPDRVFWIRGGRPVLMELKRPGERPRPLQVHILNKLKEMGYDVCTCDDAEEGIAYLRQRICAAVASALEP